jgi:hypothetical protein
MVARVIRSCLSGRLHCPSQTKVQVWLEFAQRSETLDYPREAALTLAPRTLGKKDRLKSALLRVAQPGHGLPKTVGCGRLAVAGTVVGMKSVGGVRVDHKA